MINNIKESKEKKSLKSYKSKIILALFIYIYFALAIGSISSYLITLMIVAYGFSLILSFNFGYVAIIISLFFIYFYIHEFYSSKIHAKEVGYAKLIKERKKFIIIFIFPFLFNNIFIITWIILGFPLPDQSFLELIFKLFMLIGPSIIFDYILIQKLYIKSKEIKGLRI